MIFFLKKKGYHTRRDQLLYDISHYHISYRHYDISIKIIYKYLISLKEITPLYIQLLNPLHKTTTLNSREEGLYSLILINIVRFNYDKLYIV